MDLISVERYNNAYVHTIQEKNDIWVSMKDVGNGLGVTNISDLVLKEIQGHFGFRKKLMIPDYKISVSIEHKVKSKIGTIFVNEDTLEEKYVKIYKVDLYFSEHYKKNTS